MANIIPRLFLAAIGVVLLQWVPAISVGLFVLAVFAEVGDEPSSELWEEPGYLTGLRDEYVPRWLQFLEREASRLEKTRQYRRKAKQGLATLQAEADRRGFDLL